MLRLAKLYENIVISPSSFLLEYRLLRVLQDKEKYKDTYYDNKVLLQIDPFLLRCLHLVFAAPSATVAQFMDHASQIFEHFSITGPVHGSLDWFLKQNVTVYNLQAATPPSPSRPPTGDTFSGCLKVKLMACA